MQEFEKFYHLCEKKENLQIYIDLDGVLCDFRKQFYNLTGKTPDDYIKNNSRNLLFKQIRHAGISYWEDMPWTVDGKKLWNYVKQYYPIVITTPANPESYKGKENWVKKNLGEDVKIILEKDKEKYADVNRLLIDDKSSNIFKWKEEKGFGILHKTADETIKELKEYEI